MPPDKAENSRGHAVITTFRDLQRKYLRDKEVIRSTWISLSPEQRKALIVAGANGGEEGFLRHRDDARLGSVRYIIPELNLKDLIPGENVLELLEQRATTPIKEIYPYDAHTMLTSMRVNQISHATGRKKGAVTMFLQEDEWGNGLELSRGAKGNEFDELIRMGKGCILSENEGFMILERQVHIYGFLSILVDDIMDMKRMLDDPDGNKKLPKRKRAALGSGKDIDQLLQGLDVSGGSGSSGRDVKRSLQDTLDRLVQDSQEQFLSTEDHTNLIREEPLYLSHVANNYFFSSPGMVLDENGNHDNIYNGEVATKSVLELFRDAHEATAYWRYLSALTTELAKGRQQTFSKVRNPLTDEIWSTCIKELLRARNVFRRFVQTDLKYSKFFSRNIPAGSSGSGQVQFKNPIETVAKKNKFAYWILQLAAKTQLPDTEVAQLLKNLDQFQENVAKARGDISERMGDALADIAVIIAFMTRLRQVIVLPGQAPSPSNFAKKITARMAEVEKAWTGLDLTDYVFPVDNLKEPLASQECLRVIGECLGQSGLDFNDIFRESVEDSVLEVIGELAQAEAKRQESNKDVPFDPFINPPKAAEDSKQPSTIPKIKKQTVSSTSATADPTIQKRTSTSSAPIAPAKPITAPSSAVKTFRKLFRPDSSGGIPWTAFVSAMTSIGFTVEPIGGSIARFRPPVKEEGVHQPINLHRPHPTDKFEGWALFRLRSRLIRRFGWGVDTFVAGKK